MSRSKYVPIYVACLVVVGFIAGVVGSSFLTNWFKYNRNSNFIDSNTYQAVFLTDNQTYFGRLKNVSSDYLILSDVYYVKINKDGAGQLVKLGIGEPHGPKDEMIINQDQILFWENMKFDSQVVKTIQNMQQK